VEVGADLLLRLLCWSARLGLSEQARAHGKDARCQPEQPLRFLVFIPSARVARST
jgi:hypothetical protein